MESLGAFTWLGINDSHHVLSHYKDSASNGDKLKSTSDAGGTLFDNSIVIFGSGIVDTKEIINVTILLVTLFAGNQVLKKIHNTDRRAAMGKAALAMQTHLMFEHLDSSGTLNNRALFALVL